MGGGAGAPGDDGAGMAHAAPRRRGDACDEPDHRLLHLRFLEEFRGFFLGRSADLADHDDGLSVGIGEKELEAIDEIGAVDWITADTDAARLAQPGRGGLRHRLIGQGPGTRDDADMALGVDMAGHDADLALLRRDDARAIGADEPGLGTGQGPLHRHHIEDGDTLGNTHHERDLGIDRLENRVGGEGRRDINDAGRSIRRPHRALDRVEDREIEMAGAALPRGHPAHHLGAVGDRLLGMERPLGAGEALANDLGRRIDENRHQAASFTALTTFSAASARLSAERMGSPDSARIFLPSRTLVPSSRTTSGTWRLTSRAAATIPSAITSQRMMPPKILTRIPSTLGSERMSLKAVVTRSLVAPPPTSRKLAGAPP